MTVSETYVRLVRAGGKKRKPAAPPTTAALAKATTGRAPRASRGPAPAPAGGVEKAFLRIVLQIGLVRSEAVLSDLRRDVASL